MSNGSVMWGGDDGILVETGHLSSDYVPKTIKPSKGGPQGRCLAALAIAHHQCLWDAHTTDALTFETLHHSKGKFIGATIGSFSWFKNVEYTKHTTLSGFSFAIPSSTKPIVALRDFLDLEANRNYREIKAALESSKGSSKSSQDAWHLHCVESLALDVFLTCDTALIGNIRSISDKSLQTRLAKIAVLPGDLCRLLSLGEPSDEDIQRLRSELGGFP